MEKATAVVATAPKKRLEVQQIKIPELKPNSALIKSELAGVCGSDIHIWEGKDARTRFPLILGHEILGKIVDISGDFKDFVGTTLRRGDRVLANPVIKCGKCPFCSLKIQPETNCSNVSVYGITTTSKEHPFLNGGYSDHVYAIPDLSLVKVPSDVPLELAVSAGCGGPTAVKGFENINLNFDDTVVIQGAGPVAVYALLLAKEKGARVAVIAGSKSRLQVAENLGADLIINRHSTDPEKRVRLVRSFTDGLGADFVVECAGSPEAFTEGLRYARNGGTYLNLGIIFPVGGVAVEPVEFVLGQKKIVGSFAYESRHIHQVLRLIQKNRSFLRKHLIVNRYKLGEATEALEDVRTRKVFKAALEID